MWQELTEENFNKNEVEAALFSVNGNIPYNIVYRPDYKFAKERGYTLFFSIPFAPSDHDKEYVVEAW